MLYAYVNGKFLDEKSANISAFDRGFRFGESIFETMRFANRTIFQWPFHYLRLKLGLSTLSINIDEREILAIIKNLLEINQLDKGFIRIQLSTGNHSIGYKNISNDPNIVINSMPWHEPDHSPASLCISKTRTIPPICFPKGFKSGQSLNYTMAAKQAMHSGFDDALMLDINDNIAETSAANIFWLKGNKIFTPSLKTGCVSGCIRNLITQNFDVLETEEKISTIYNADFAFITNINHLYKPIQKIDTHPIKNTKNSLFKEIAQIIKEQLTIN